MDIPNLNFFLRFGLTSYSAVFFFTVGLGFAFAYAKHLRLPELVLIFGVISIVLHFSFKSESPQAKVIIALIWTSLLWAGFRFGQKIIKR